MGRPPGSKNKNTRMIKDSDLPKQPRAPRAPKTDGGIGHNSGEMDDGQFRVLLMDAVGKIETAKSKTASCVSDERNLYKKAKADGISKAQIDHAIAQRKRTPEEIKAEENWRQKITEWCHPGIQAELFGEHDADIDRAYEAGKEAGVAGHDPVAPRHFASQADRWIAGYHAGQAINVSGITELAADEGEDDPRPAFLRNGGEEGIEDAAE